MAEATVPENFPQWMKDHIQRYLSSGGKDGHMMPLPSSKAPVPTLLLTTTGRKSGEKFLFPLIYGKAGESYVIIASKGGAPEHPGWYRNLLANPAVELQVADRKLKAKARTATGAERTTLWSQMAALFPPYNDYQRKAGGREIPVVVLDPTDA
jgi:deazaflavin-dependent oxidoreductase (nitroreductase family)